MNLYIRGMQVRSIISFIKDNDRLARMLLFFYVLPNILLFSSDFIYADDTNMMYWNIALILFGVLLIFAYIGYVNINEVYEFTDEGLLGKYLKSWGFVILPIFWFSAWFFFEVLIVSLPVELILFETMPDSIFDKFLNISLFLYFLIFSLVIPFFHIFTIRYIFGKGGIKGTIEGLFRISLREYVALVFLMLVNIGMLATTFEFSTTITILALFVAGVFNFIYLIVLAQLTLKQMLNVGIH